MNIDDRDFDIAIVGMAGRYPKARNLKEYWQNLRDGKECFTALSDEQMKQCGVSDELLQDPNYVKVSPVLEDYDKFDARFFGYTPREASMMDPQQRLFLECCWEAFEDAGYDPVSYGDPVGVFGGAAINSYMIFSGVYNRFYTEFLPSVVGNDVSFIANRVSYQLNLQGPSVSVQTACSTSLVSVHLSIQSLLNGECSMALAGGVAVWVPHEAGHLHKEGSVFTKDGHCRTFDAKATGTIFGSGAGVVLLKRFNDAIEDGDEIYAVIKGSAVNNDGAQKTDYTAPSIDGQAKVIVEALANSGLSAEDISYVETHGTGTFIGDPIEIRALTKAYNVYTDRKQFCRIGSVKPNIGHLDAAAGVSGLIKTVLAMNHRMLPPSINFDEPNPAIDFDNSPFRVNTELSEWNSADGQPLRAGITSLGMGGTNAHVIIEEAPSVERPVVEDKGPFLITYSAKKKESLDDYAAKLSDYLENNPDVPVKAAGYTLQTGRKQFQERRYLTAGSREELIGLLKEQPRSKVKTYNDVKEGREVVFLFPGQGAQYVNMGRDLYRDNKLFRKYLDLCAEILTEIIDTDIRDLLFPEEGQEDEASEKLRNTIFTQPVIFSIEYCLAKIWIDMGIKPVTVLGHSIGEFTAACIAGVFDLETGLRLVAKRGSIMQKLEKGSMLAVMVPHTDLEEYMNEDLSVACINTPDSCIISGPIPAIDDLSDKLEKKNIYTKILATSHAFHSHMMEPVLEEFRAFASEMSYKQPRIPIISTVRADWIDKDEVTTPDYWVKNIRQAVCFADAVEKLFDKPDWILLEVGPGNTLTTLAKQHPRIDPDQVLIQSLRHPKEEVDDGNYLLAAAGRLWSCGYDLDWKVFYGEVPVYKVTGMPTYAFQRERCWLDPVLNSGEVGAAGNGLNKRDDDLQQAGDEEKDVVQELTEIWEEFLGIDNVGPDDDFFGLGGNSLVAVQLFDELKYKLGVSLPLSALFEAPTINAIAKLIEPEMAEKKKKPAKKDHTAALVKIQPDGDKTPFFCIHGHYGNVLFFKDLANRLGKDRPFYGIQSVGLSGEETPLLSIEDMAKRYLSEMKSVQPEGPYLFGGYCYGTLVCMEIVRLLDESGESYYPPVMIDPQPNAYEKVLSKESVKSFQKLSLEYRKQVHLDRMSERKLTGIINYLFSVFDSRLILIGKKMIVKRWMLKAYIQLSKVFDRIPLPSFLKVIYLTNMVAHWNYADKLSGEFSADVHIILPEDIINNYASDPAEAWKGFSRGNITLHLVKDDGVIMSGEMFSEPYVKGFAKVLESIFEASEACTETSAEAEDLKEIPSTIVSS